MLELRQKSTLTVFLQITEIFDGRASSSHFCTRRVRSGRFVESKATAVRDPRPLFQTSFNFFSDVKRLKSHDGEKWKIWRARVATRKRSWKNDRASEDGNKNWVMSDETEIRSCTHLVRPLNPFPLSPFLSVFPGSRLCLQTVLVSQRRRYLIPAYWLSLTVCMIPTA